MPKFHYGLLEDHRADYRRSGEGSAVELKDGRLLLLYTAFRGRGSLDHDEAWIQSRISEDGGMSWQNPRIRFKAPSGALNCMSASLLRLQDGRIGCVFLVKWSRKKCLPYWSVSTDEGEHWSAPVPIVEEDVYLVVVNDRLIQLQNGSLVVPYALHKNIPDNADDTELLKTWLNGYCGVLYSTDNGQSWQRPATGRRYEKQWFTPPSPPPHDELSPAEKETLTTRYDVFQEPGVVELSDGRLLLWVRSLNHIFYATTDACDQPWTEFSTFPGFNVSNSPQTLKRLPGTKKLILLYNDRGDIPFGHPEFQTRTPLSVAVSEDDAATWQKLSPLEEDTSRSYCYFSLLFFGSRFLATYYESALRQPPPDGRPPRRRNLASLKTCVGDLHQLFPPLLR